MIDGSHIAQEDLALFAMHGCSEQEAAAVRAHVEQCTECRGELEKVMADLSAVAMSVEQFPLPEGARERFIGMVAASSPDHRATKPAGELQGRTEAIPIQRNQKSRKLVLWFPWSLAAVLAFFAVGLMYGNFHLQRELREEEHQLADVMEANTHAQAVLDLLTAPKAQHVMLTAGKVHPAPSARAVYLASSGGLILEASNLAPLPEHKAYELWVIPADGKAPIPAGLFWPDSAGSASLVMPKLPAGVEAKAFGVTIEKDEGASSPTSPIILAGGD